MESRRVQFHPEAESEYVHALSWYSDRSRVAGARFEVAFQQALNKIAESPATWPIYLGELRRYNLRRFPYSIFYRAERDQIFVLAVAHGRRKPSYWRERV